MSEDNKVVPLRPGDGKQRDENLRKGGGRPPGTPNKTTTHLKQALLLAGKVTGNRMHKDGRATQKDLTGYLEWLAEAEPKSFAMLLAKILPIEMRAEVTVNDGLSDRLARARERVIEGTAQRR